MGWKSALSPRIWAQNFQNNKRRYHELRGKPSAVSNAIKAKVIAVTSPLMAKALFWIAVGFAALLLIVAVVSVVTYPIAVAKEAVLGFLNRDSEEEMYLTDEELEELGIDENEFAELFGEDGVENFERCLDSTGADLDGISRSLRELPDNTNSTFAISWAAYTASFTPEFREISDSIESSSVTVEPDPEPIIEIDEFGNTIELPPEPEPEPVIAPEDMPMTLSDFTQAFNNADDASSMSPNHIVSSLREGVPEDTITLLVSMSEYAAYTTDNFNVDDPDMQELMDLCGLR